ncbi:hypothetical protein J5N97_006275 [Dioscorea zingiberensis]|uniref:NB-ARC domain-containing protein n=1 Tax=Dioscorea zingiberensis TaxID=325984 RepID=A0A9D5HT73_9LILI|nr:hypothetical protein J5N97_006275 [Dioscorea zingiberensis]
MDPLQAIASATQIVSSMVGAVSALEQASRNISEAPKRIRVLEDFVSDLENLTRRIKQKHAHKIHSPQLERQFSSLSGMIERLHLNLAKARRIVSKNKAKNLAKVVWSSMVGDPLSKLIQLIRDDLNWWLELQRLTENVERVIESTAENVPFLLKVNAEQGYPVSKKCHYVRKLLEQEESHQVILIVGLSGIGKSCLARSVAADPPGRFVHGAVELRFGQWCSRAACKGSRDEYHKRLGKRLGRFLVQIGFMKKAKNEVSGDLEDLCCLLQTALVGKSILILLEDVWEQDIVERFTKLYDNDCKYLVTTRNEAVFEITEAEKVEICKEDIKEISREILLYHSLLTNEELPYVAETLLDRCGHHPLTVAVIGKALRNETRVEKWEKAISDLSTYATCAPGPVSYVNEKESENNTLTIFGSFEFSLEAMPENSQKFFIVLASISWAEPVPEACLEALWSVLGQESLFSLVVCKLVEGSLLIKMDAHMLYHVHDMVSLYLEKKTDDAIRTLLLESTQASVASISPWLFIFGKENVRIVAEEKIKFLLTVSQKSMAEAAVSLETIAHALMASKSISEFEASRKSFSIILCPRVTELICTGSKVIIFAAAKAITVIFTNDVYCEYAPFFENTGALDNLIRVLEDSDSPSTTAIISSIVAKLAEHGSSITVSKVLPSIPLNQLGELLTPNAVEWHESIFTTLMSLTTAGKSEAVERMIASGIDKKLVMLLENGSEVAQHHAIVILKTFCELGGLLDQQGSLKSGTLNLLPWHARLSLEGYFVSDRKILLSPKPQIFEDILNKIIKGDDKQLVDAMQDLINYVEKASEPRILDMILQSSMIERLALLLQPAFAECNRARSESAFLLMKLACAGGEPIIRKFLELDITHDLVKMMQCSSGELQDVAYTTLHQIVFGKGGTLVLNRLLQTKLIEKLIHSLDSKSHKTKEVCMLFLVDLSEVGTKSCIERMLALHVVEKLVNVEKLGGIFTGTLTKFLKGLDMCKNLSAAERQVMKQQVVRKVRSVIKGHKLEASLIASIEAAASEGSRGASSSKPRKW